MQLLYDKGGGWGVHISLTHVAYYTTTSAAHKNGDGENLGCSTLLTICLFFLTGNKLHSTGGDFFASNCVNFGFPKIM